MLGDTGIKSTGAGATILGATKGKKSQGTTGTSISKQGFFFLRHRQSLSPIEHSLIQAVSIFLLLSDIR